MENKAYQGRLEYHAEPVDDSWDNDDTNPNPDPEDDEYNPDDDFFVEQIIVRVLRSQGL